MIQRNTEELVRLAQAGNHAAYAELMQRHETAVYAVAFEKMRDAGEAQELAHEAFVRAYTKLHQLREPAAFVGWVRRIAVRLALNRLTRRRLNQAEEATIEMAEARAVNPLDAVLRNEARTTVQEGLERLNRMDRETLVAFYVRGQSIREMAVAFATPEGTIKRRLHVARRRLKETLEDEGNSRLARVRHRPEVALSVY